MPDCNNSNGKGFFQRSFTMFVWFKIVLSDCWKRSDSYLRSQQTRMNWNELKWIQLFRNIDSRMLKWMLYNSKCMFIHLLHLKHISMPLNLKIIFNKLFLCTTYTLWILQFKILNRKCSFLIACNWI